MTQRERIDELMLKFICGDESSFFGRFMSYILIIETESVKTASASILSTGPIIVYNKKFLETLDDSQLQFLFMHEMFHLLQGHLERGVNLNHKVHNIATDAIINNYIEHNTHTTPPADGIRLDPEYKMELISEFYYLWLIKNDKVPQDGGDEDESESDGENDGDNSESQSSGSGQGSDGNGKPNKGKKGKYGTHYDDHDYDPNKLDEKQKEELGIQGSVKITDPNMARSIIDNIIQSVKSRGCNTGFLDKFLDNLRKSKKNYIKDIMGGLSFIMGRTKYRSYKRPNRRNITGLKGNLKYTNEICVLLDTSGSMCGEFEKALGVLFSRDVVCHIIMCDTEIKGVHKVTNNKELSNLKISGLGGTLLQPGINYALKDKNLCKMNTLILTDGYCDDLNTSKLKKCLVLTTGFAPKVSENTKVIAIEKNNI